MGKLQNHKSGQWLGLFPWKEREHRLEVLVFTVARADSRERTRTQARGFGLDSGQTNYIDDPLFIKPLKPACSETH